MCRGHSQEPVELRSGEAALATIRRGVAPTVLALYIESTSAAVPARLMAATIKSAIGTAEAGVSPTVTLLIQGVLRAMFMKKLSMVAITVVASLTLATGAGVWRGRQQVCRRETKRTGRTLKRTLWSRMNP